jgi:hypothetical protein
MDGRSKHPAIFFRSGKEKNARETSKRSALERCSAAFKSLFKRQPEDNQYLKAVVDIPPSHTFGEQQRGFLGSKKWISRGTDGTRQPTLSQRAIAAQPPKPSPKKVVQGHTNDAMLPTPAPKRYIHPWKASQPLCAPPDQAISLKELAARAKPKVDTGRNPAKQPPLPSAPTSPRSQVARPATPPPGQFLSRLARTDSTASNLSSATATSAGTVSAKSHQSRRGLASEKDRSLIPVECTRKGLYLATSPGSFYPTPPKRAHEQDLAPRRKSSSPALQAAPRGKSTTPSTQTKPAWRNAAAHTPPPHCLPSPRAAKPAQPPTSATPQRPGKSSQSPSGLPRLPRTPQPPSPSGSERLGQSSTPCSQFSPLGEGMTSLSTGEASGEARVALGGGGRVPPSRTLVPLEIPSPCLGGTAEEPPHQPVVCESPSVLMQQTISIGAGMQMQEEDGDWLMVRLLARPWLQTPLPAWQNLFLVWQNLFPVVAATCSCAPSYACNGWLDKCAAPSRSIFWCHMGMVLEPGYCGGRPGILWMQIPNPFAALFCYADTGNFYIF